MKPDLYSPTADSIRTLSFVSCSRNALLHFDKSFVSLFYFNIVWLHVKRMLRGNLLLFCCCSNWRNSSKTSWEVYLLIVPLTITSVSYYTVKVNCQYFILIFICCICYLLFLSYQSINQSTFIYIRQPEPIVARPIFIKKNKEKHTQHSTNITTPTNEKREKLSCYWNETSAAEHHTYIFNDFLKTWQS